MKVLLVLDSYPPDLNGGAYFTHRLAKSLVHHGIDIKVACPSLHFGTQEDEYEGVSLHRFSSYPSALYREFRIINPILLRKKTKKLLSTFRPDLVHLQGKFILGNAIFKEAKKMNIPCVATNHLMPQNFEHHFKIPNFLRSSYTKFVWKWVFEMYHQLPLVISPTQSGADELHRNGLKTPTKVISCGVKHELFAAPYKKEDWKKKFDLPNVPIVLYTGRLDKEKNIDIVFHACHLALQKTKFHLVLTGSGKEEKSLKDLAKKLNILQHITFTGKLMDDIFPSIYLTADVFVNACHVELQCISALEAIAAGLPVILAHGLALPELVNTENRNGFTFPPGNFDELSDLLYRVLSDDELRSMLGKNSSLLAQQHDLKNTALEHIHLYRKMINPSIQ